MGWKNLDKGEKGTVIGFLLGLYLLFMSYVLDFNFNTKFCLDFFEKFFSHSLCIRYVSLLPLIIAIIGMASGYILKAFENNEEGSNKYKNAKRYVEKMKARGHSKQDIRKMFKSRGWDEEQINKII